MSFSDLSTLIHPRSCGNYAVYLGEVGGLLRSLCQTQPRQTQNICITFVQCWPSVEDFGPTLYKCYTKCWICVKRKFSLRTASCGPPETRLIKRCVVYDIVNVRDITGGRVATKTISAAGPDVTDRRKSDTVRSVLMMKTEKSPVCANSPFSAGTSLLGLCNKPT